MAWGRGKYRLEELISAITDAIHVFSEEMFSIECSFVLLKQSGR